MREILFRGKRIYSDEWIESLVAYLGEAYGERIALMVERGSGTIADDARNDGLLFRTGVYQVIPETIGQYTGLTDKNGTKIFEGDIVKLTDAFVGCERTAFIEFGNPNGLYNWGWQLHPISKEPFAEEILFWVDTEVLGAFIEVIGNIHDNPELLRGDL